MPETDPHALADRWLAAWNARDLERILALYAEDAAMTSPRILQLALSPDGRLQGKAALRRYWGMALQRRPGLRFDLLDLFAGPGCLVLHYRDDQGHRIAEYLRHGPDGLIREAAALHRPAATGG